MSAIDIHQVLTPVLMAAAVTARYHTPKRRLPVRPSVRLSHSWVVSTVKTKKHANCSPVVIATLRLWRWTHTSTVVKRRLRCLECTLSCVISIRPIALHTPHRIYTNLKIESLAVETWERQLFFLSQLYLNPQI